MTLRFNVAGRIAGHLLSSNRSIALHDLGLGGFSAEVAWPVPAGPYVVQLVTPDNKSTLLQARSVYCRPSADGRYWAGFEFARRAYESDRAIKRMLQLVTPLRLGMMWV
jgi:hypothetical protein